MGSSRISRLAIEIEAAEIQTCPRRVKAALDDHLPKPVTNEETRHRIASGSPDSSLSLGVRINGNSHISRHLGTNGKFLIILGFWFSTWVKNLPTAFSNHQQACFYRKMSFDSAGSKGTVNCSKATICGPQHWASATTEPT